MGRSTVRQFALFTISCLTFCLLLSGCAEDSEPPMVSESSAETTAEPAEENPAEPGETVSETTGENPASETTGEEVVEEEVVEEEVVEEEVVEEEVEAAPIGEPVSEPVEIDHGILIDIVESNIAKHINGLDEALTFIEDAKPITNFIELLSDDEEDDVGCSEEVCDEEEEEPEEDEPFEVDLSELRDDVLTFVTEELMVESTGTFSEDGLSASYAIDPEIVCADDDEEHEDSDHTHDDEGEQIDNMEDEGPSEDELKCLERLENNPLQLDAMSDGEDRINLSLKAGNAKSEVFQIQIHSDMMSVSVSMANFHKYLAVFVDPEDFELAEEMSGTLACEVRDQDSLTYAVRCAIPEAIVAVPGAGQEAFGLSIPAMENLVVLTLNGTDGIIEGAAGSDAIDVDLPWQWIINLLHDDKVDVEVCSEEPPCEGCEPDCWYEEQEVDAPDVEGTSRISIPGPGGSLVYTSELDVFQLRNLTLGEGVLLVTVEEDSLLQVALNPKEGNIMDVNLLAEDMNILFQMLPKLDLEVTIGAWDRVLDSLPDMWQLEPGESIGIQLDGADAPTLTIVQEDDEVDFRVSEGNMTMSSSNMDEDIVIEAGQCMASLDDDVMGEEEKDEQHPIFGGMVGETCE